MQVVGTAHNGKAALLKIKSLQPDLLTLDIEMPEVNGLEVLSQLREVAPHIGAVMLSTLTHDGGVMTMKALELGAFDFLPKPQSGTMAANKEAVLNALRPILSAFRRSRHIAGVKTKARPTAAVSQRCNKITTAGSSTIFKERTRPSSIIGIGISTGRPNALAQMLPHLPGDINVPVVIVQHMPPMFTESLAKSLDNKCALSVKEAIDGEPVFRRHVPAAVVVSAAQFDEFLRFRGQIVEFLAHGEGDQLIAGAVSYELRYRE